MVKGGIYKTKVSKEEHKCFKLFCNAADATEDSVVSFYVISLGSAYREMERKYKDKELSDNDVEGITNDLLHEYFPENKKLKKYFTSTLKYLRKH